MKEAGLPAYLQLNDPTSNKNQNKSDKLRNTKQTMKNTNKTILGSSLLAERVFGVGSNTVVVFLLPKCRFRSTICRAVLESRQLRHSTFQRIFGRTEKVRGAGSSLGHRFTRFPDPTGAPSQSEVRRTFREPHQDGS